MARHCYLLLAYYDGHDTQLMGGTAQVVSIQREEIYPLFVNVAEVAASREPAALICHGTPRIKHATPKQQLGEIRYWPIKGHSDELITADPTIPEALLQLPRQLEAINRQVAAPDLKAAEEPEGLHTRLHAALSEAAGALKQQHIRLIELVVVLGFALIVIAELLEGKFWFGGFLLVVLASLAWLPRLQQTSKERFIEKRSLVECLSVQYLWSAVGVELDTADLFHVRNHNQLRIARMMLRAVKVQLLALYSQEQRPMQDAMATDRAAMAAATPQCGSQQGSTAMSAVAEGADQSGSSYAGSALKPSQDLGFEAVVLAGIYSNPTQTATCSTNIQTTAT